MLGSGNKYCLSFGFIVIGASLMLFISYNNEKLQKCLNEIAEEIDEIDYFSLKPDQDEEEFDIEKEEEKSYVVRELAKAQTKLKKRKRRSAFMFGLCSIGLIFLGFIGLF